MWSVICLSLSIQETGQSFNRLIAHIYQIKDMDPSWRPKLLQLLSMTSDIIYKLSIRKFLHERHISK